MMASAIFYERDQSTPTSDVLASLVTSLLGMCMAPYLPIDTSHTYSFTGTGPQRIIKIIFVKSKPKKRHIASEILSRNMEGGKCDVDMEKYQKISAIRLELYRRMYGLPSWCRECGWVTLLLISMVAFSFAV